MTAAQSHPGEFSQLVDELVELEQERTGVGPGGLSGERAAARARIERRLMHLLCAEIAADERRGSIRVPTNLGVQVKAGANAAGASARGKLTNVGVGGAFIETTVPAAVGDEVSVTVERGRDSFEHTF